MTEKKEMTVEEAGKKLREMAELTAKHSRNWENFQEIATSMLRQAFNAGKEETQDDKT